MKRAGNSGLQGEVEGAGLGGGDRRLPACCNSQLGWGRRWTCVRGNFGELGGRIMEASGFLLALGGDLYFLAGRPKVPGETGLRTRIHSKRGTL